MGEEETFAGIGSQVFIGRKKEDGTVENLCTVDVKAETDTKLSHDAELICGDDKSKQSWNVWFQLVDEHEEDIKRAEELFEQFRKMQEEHCKIVLLHGRRRKAMARKYIREAKAFRKKIEAMNLNLPFYMSSPILVIDRALEELVYFTKGACIIPTWVQIEQNHFVPARMHVTRKNGKVSKEIFYD